MIITLSHLSIGYAPRQSVVSNINAEIRSGQLTCLIGENGIGKSTLLKTLTGFLPKVSGKLLLDGQDISTLSQRELARKVSIVLTQKPDVQNLTVSEVVGLGRSPYTGFWGKLRTEDKLVVDDAIAAVGITRLRERKIQTLSDGERQKVMIAKALAQQTPVILLDEPTAFLDFPSKVDTFQFLLRTAHEHDKLILLSTHDLELAVRFADCLLEVSGAGLQTASSEEV
ncbi:MAG: ABC transporter ATP-binding protein, partial [Prevotella sp.]|nr:ABC transporter ATP-binding protein [Prevotella sp.]